MPDRPLRLSAVALNRQFEAVAHVTVKRGTVHAAAFLRRSVLNPGRLALVLGGEFSPGNTLESAITVEEALERWPDAREDLRAALVPRDREKVPAHA